MAQESLSTPAGLLVGFGRGRRRPNAAPCLGSILVWVYALISVYPLVWLVIQTFRSDSEILSLPFGFPTRPSVDAYVKVWQSTPLPQFLFNSAVVTITVVIVTVLCSSAAGYALSVLKFPLSGAVYGMFLVGLLVPGSVLLLPTFLISGQLGILDTYLGLIGPYSAGALLIGVYLMKTHFDLLPRELVEAATLDRASAIQIFWQVMLPLARPAAATVAVLTFMGAWNEYVYAAVSLQDQNLFTLPIGVASLAARRYVSGVAPILAAMVITAIPVYAVFFFAQRTFVSSLTSGSIKG